MNLKHPYPFVALLAIAASVGGCGGSGGSGGRTVVNRGAIPPAPDPVCSSVVHAQFVPRATPVGGNEAGVLVPATSVPQGGYPSRAHTNHLILVRAAGTRSQGPSGLSPSQVLKAYSIPANAGHDAIAVIDAFDYPNALADFNTFSQTFGLPTETSTNPTASSNQVFQVVYAGGTQPAPDAGWAQEMAVDSQWSHAMASRAKIYLVEAASANLPDLITAIGVAKRLPGVRQVSISFGSPEDACSLVNYDSVFVQPGVSFFASSGDTSGERDFPAESANVVAVGGTTLTVGPDGTWISEIAWNSTGGGPSQFEPRPVFQDGIQKQVLGFRADADVAAVGDPQTGVSVYDSMDYQGSVGWQVYGGTSTSTPIIAGIANAAASFRSGSQDQCAALYAALGSANLHDITAGVSGTQAAQVGWDFPTGVGSPKGVGAF